MLELYFSLAYRYCGKLVMIITSMCGRSLGLGYSGPMMWNLVTI